MHADRSVTTEWTLVLCNLCPLPHCPVVTQLAKRCREMAWGTWERDYLCLFPSFTHSDMAAVQRYDDARHVRAPLTVSHSSPSILSAAESSTEKRSYQSTRAGLKQALKDSVVRSPLPCPVRINAR